MSAALPDQLDPWRAVKLGLSYRGILPLAEFARLAAAVLPETDGEPTQIQYHLCFERDADQRALVRGQVQAQLHLPCQRCLSPVTLPVDATWTLMLIKTQSSADALEDESDVETLIVTDTPVCPRDLIEDELLLAIPVVARHEVGQCQVPHGRHSNDAGAHAQSNEQPPNPFAVLATLKGRPKK